MQHHRPPLDAGRRRLGRPALPLLQARRQVPLGPSRSERGHQVRYVLPPSLSTDSDGKVLTPSCIFRLPLSGHPRFFLGSDSAPHPSLSKTTTSPNVGCAAGVYTSSHLLALCAALLDSFGALDSLIGYVSTNGRKFYGLPTEGLKGVTVVRNAQSEQIERFTVAGGGELVPFWEGKSIGWEIIRD